jgi:catechol 2,3-dioxygenase-like lactoylglutathione lyase family enzyme
MAVSRIARISFTSAEVRLLADFYRDALGFEPLGSAEPLGPGNRGMRAIALRLGEQILELVAFRDAGKPYPSDVAVNDLRFQHIAIVVSDMTAAYARLCACGGWTSITHSGPQCLPEGSGGVTAFKFRDPEGHPLELLAFSAAAAPRAWRRGVRSGLFLGIAHSAIGAADTTRSVAFYENLLGFTMAGQTLNAGVEQARLDNLEAPVVQVTSLFSSVPSFPHLELLCYRHPLPCNSPRLADNDVAATRLVIEICKDKLAEISNIMQQAGDELGSGAAVAPGGKAVPLIRDPDGHLLVLIEARE